MPFHYINGDLTKMQTDAIVNAANSRLAPGGGVCGAIFAAAGYDKLDRACRRIGGCPTGEAVLTEGFALPARYVIHTVGPVWQGGTKNEPALLKSCYQNSLRTAKEHGCASIAFPLISAGIYGYPREDALQIAVSAIREFLQDAELEVSLVLFGREPSAIGGALRQSIRAYLDEPRADEGRSPFAAESSAGPAAAPDEPFPETLSRFLRQKRLHGGELCRRANISRALLDRLQQGCPPARHTALALAAALQLEPDEMGALLRHAGPAPSRPNRADAIFEYFVRQGRYDVWEINAALFTFGQKQLGA